MNMQNRHLADLYLKQQELASQQSMNNGSNISYETYQYNFEKLFKLNKNYKEFTCIHCDKKFKHYMRTQMFEQSEPYSVCPFCDNIKIIIG